MWATYYYKPGSFELHCLESSFVIPASLFFFVNILHQNIIKVQHSFKPKSTLRMPYARLSSPNTVSININSKYPSKGTSVISTIHSASSSSFWVWYWIRFTTPLVVVASSPQTRKKAQIVPYAWSQVVCRLHNLHKTVHIRMSEKKATTI